MNRILPLLAGLVVLLFAAVWLGIAWELWNFDPTDDDPTLDLSDAVVTVAGFLASAVGAGTASVLGIEIQKVAQEQADARRSMAATVQTAASRARLVSAGIIVYAVVGVIVLLVWLKESEVAPDVIKTFSLGALGWLAGAFAAVFRAEG